MSTRPNAQKNPYHAYSRATHTVAKTRQIVMLYDGIITNLKQAREAMLNKQIETRYNKLVRASEIIAGLQMSLDFESAPDASQVLYDFYSFVDSRIMQMHRTNNAEHCEQIIEEVKHMRELWYQIDQGQSEQDAMSAALPAAADAEPVQSAAGESAPAALPAVEGMTFSA